MLVRPRRRRLERSSARSAHQCFHHKRPSPAPPAGSGPGPYILVGHSIGGSFARIYAGRFPGEVAGLVLVDSANPDQN
ncbi:MAG TPA: alpha/beta fold hydrolase, partial [Candidatus Dormibacteraeota bacterium]|nr:alpha/beta fold hydrolase [Candidatus Dormibacteraeota bacterium]